MRQLEKIVAPFDDAAADFRCAPAVTAAAASAARQLAARRGIAALGAMRPTPRTRVRSGDPHDATMTASEFFVDFASETRTHFADTLWLSFVGLGPATRRRFVEFIVMYCLAPATELLRCECAACTRLCLTWRVVIA